MFTLDPWEIISRIFKPFTYGERIEQYIISKNPKTPTDVERFTEEWIRSQSKGWL